MTREAMTREQAKNELTKMTFTEQQAYFRILHMSLFAIKFHGGSLDIDKMHYDILGEIAVERGYKFSLKH